MSTTDVLSNSDTTGVHSPWSRSTEEIASELRVDPKVGLSTGDSRKRQATYGPNAIEATEGRGPLRMFLAQFADLMIGLLIAAAAISAVVGEMADAVLIGIIVLANAIIGFIQEFKAEKAIAAVKQLAHPVAHVWRDGRLAEVAVEEIVPGDVIETKAGDMVPADARLLECSAFQTLEAALTGESMPSEKTANPVAPDESLPGRTSMIYMGTAVNSGRARAVVTGTGMQTELGTIARLLSETEQSLTPLQQRLASLSRKLAIVVLVVCAIIFVTGVLRDPRSPWNSDVLTEMLLVAVSLAVAAIPEGLPAVITVALAGGSERMARRNAIVRRLPAVETLGSVDVICSDKTGTLTQNRMSVAELLPTIDGPATREQFDRAAALCNDAEITGADSFLGSATEVAILQKVIEQGSDVSAIRADWPRVAEIPFSSARKRMGTLHESKEGHNVLIVKGAVEQIVGRSTQVGWGSERTDLLEETREQWLSKSNELAARGHRLLAIAARNWDQQPLTPDAETELSLLGIVGLVDPPRPEARDAIQLCRSAGIRPVMITGDHQVTARSIAEDLSIWSEGDQVLNGSELEAMSAEELAEAATHVSVYARVSPEHKLRIVKAYQSHGSIVSMTGDGVNDAPALKQADIGVAMGVTGTDVAKESAEMILADDNFATIVAAVEEGRVVYDNIRKFVKYLLTANAGEILTIFFSILIGLPLPLLPIHILWVNLVTDGLPALALGFEPGESDIMQRRPRRRDESIFSDGLVQGIVGIGLLMGVSCTLLFYIAEAGYLPLPADIVAEGREATLEYSQTLTFMTLSMFQLFYVLGIRSAHESFFHVGLWRNYRLTGAFAIGCVLQFVVVYWPFAQKYFHTRSLSPFDLLLALGISTLALVACEIRKAMRPRQTRDAS